MKTNVFTFEFVGFCSHGYNKNNCDKSASDISRLSKKNTNITNNMKLTVKKPSIDHSESCDSH